MERNDIAKKIREIIDNLLVVTIDKEVPETSKLVDDLQMDDLDKVELIMTIEEVFGIDIREDYTEFNTLEDVINRTEQYLTSKEAETAGKSEEETSDEQEGEDVLDDETDVPADQSNESIEGEAPACAPESEKAE